ncbi:MAG: SMP-30/gluconolactonase/LRE family protein [Parvularcula sp.]|nr:SMP-30/gluconolactonase/LRE family protein [Parvularcula sp.]
MASVTVWLGFTFHQFTEYGEAGDMRCTPVVGIAGASDIEPVDGENVAYLSVFDERGGAERGALVRFDLDNPLDDASWRDRTFGRPVLFRPGGIDLYEERLPSGVLWRRLFVVNHEGPEILVFDVEEDGNLSLAERYSTDLLVSPNDVVATGPDAFYVTNDTGSGRQSLRGKADFLFGIPNGSILHFDGNDWSVAADGLRFPNGIALAPDGSTLYVAEMRAEAVRRFERDPATGVLEPRMKIALEAFPNNLSIDENGILLIGAVPQPFAYKAFTSNLRETSPSQVYRVENDRPALLYQDPGQELSAATAAATVAGRTLIGTGGDRKFLMCQARPGSV